MAAVGLSVVMTMALGPQVNAAVPSGGSLTVQAQSSAAAVLRFTLPGSAVTVQVLREGRLLDVFPAGAGSSYTDYLLWPRATYHYEVRAFDVGGGGVADLTGAVTIPARTGWFPRLYDPSSFWNQPISPSAKADLNTKAIVARSLTPYASISNLITDNKWGITMAYANPVSKLYSVGCIKYDCNMPVSFHIPRYATANSGQDGKLVVLDPVSHTELDMGVARYDGASDSWSTNSRYTAESDGWGAMCAPYQRCGAVLGSGLDQMGGVIRPEEIAQGDIRHALVLAVPYKRANFIACPAVKTAGGVDDPRALPFGARIQLDPAFNVSATNWPRWEKIVARAFQQYGGYVGDIGGSLAVRAEPSLNRGYDPWPRAGVSQLSPSLRNLPWSRFRVLKLQSC